MNKHRYKLVPFLNKSTNFFELVDFSTILSLILSENDGASIRILESA